MYSLQKTFIASLTFLLLFSFGIKAQDLKFNSKTAKSTGETLYQVRVDESVLLNSLKEGQNLELELNGKRYIQQVKRMKPLKFGYRGISGMPIEGNSHSYLLLKDRKLSGVLHFEGTPFRLSFEKGEYRFFEITEEAHSCAFDATIYPRNHSKSITKTGGENAIPSYDPEDYSDTTTVDVLVLYTTAAKEWAAHSSNVTDIFELIALNESFKNTIIDNSEFALKIRFVNYLEIADNNETSASDILTDMALNTYTGSPDTVDIHALQDQYGADLVTIYEYFNDGTGGIGYRPNEVGGSPDYGFSVNRVQQLYFTYTVMHELGHNFGNAHGRTQANNAAGEKGGIFQFSTGHSFSGSSSNEYVTVMHYEGLSSGGSAETVPYFSNPRVTYEDSLTGSYSGAGGPSDNTLSMSISKKWIADYQTTVIDPPSLSLSTTAIEDTVYPSGVSVRDIIIDNTGDSDLEIYLDGEMNYSTSLKSRKSKTIKQPLEISYGFEESEGYETGSYSGYNNWKTTNDDLNFEITTAQAFSGSQSLRVPMYSNYPSLLSPYFSTSSRYSDYYISFKAYMEGSPSAIVKFPSSEDISSGFWLQDDNQIRYYENSDGLYYSYGETYSNNNWHDFSITLTADNGGEAGYIFDNGTTRTRSSGLNFPEMLEISLQSSNSSDYIYIDDLQITANDLYGPALSISDNSLTIPAGTTDTISVTFYGNGYTEGIYDGTIYVETNDPNNASMTIPVDLHIDPYNLYSNDEFAVELTGQEGFRMLTAPTDVNLMNFLESLHTQGALNADYSGGSPNVWIWNNAFAGNSNSGWNPVADLDTTISAGNAFLIYVFNEDIFGDSTSRGFPKLLTVNGSPTDVASPDINQNENSFTLVGNPFPATVDWDEIYQNSGTTELSGSIYAYDPVSSQWKSYNSVTGVGDLANGLIRPFQGFFVQSSGSISSESSLVFESNDATAGGEFYGKYTNKSLYGRFEISTKEQTLRNSSYIVIHEEAKKTKDDLDAVEMPPFTAEYLSLSFQSEDETALDINAIPDFGQSITIPVSIRSSNADPVLFSITDAYNMDDISIYLNSEKWSKPISLNQKIELDVHPLETSSQKLLTKTASIEFGNDLSLTFLKQNTATVEESTLPKTFSLMQNYPNPFNPVTAIEFGLPQKAFIKLSVYNTLGQLVEILVDESLSAGFHSYSFDASNLSSGVYLYKLEAGTFVSTKKMILVK